MWFFSAHVASLFQGETMKFFGILTLLAGLALGGYALTMNVGVEVPARDFGYGIKTEAMEVANVDKMAQRQNFLIFSGILSVVGAILVGFGSMAPKTVAAPAPPPADPLPELEAQPKPAGNPTTVTICPKCRHMGDGDSLLCKRCSHPLG